MTNEDPEALVAFRQLVGEARAGSLTVALKPAEFSALDNACETFKTAIRKIQREMQRAGDASVSWGLGEDNHRLSSAITLVGKYRDLATGEGNSLTSVLDGHFDVATEIQALFKVILDDYIRTDEEFATEFRLVNTKLETGDR